MHFRWSHLEEAEKLLLRAGLLDDESEEIPYELSQLYRLMSTESGADAEILGRQCVEQLEEAFLRYSKTSEQGSYLMVYFDMVLAETANSLLFSNLSNETRRLAQLMSRRWELDKNKFPSERDEHKRSRNRAQALFGRAALVDGDKEAARKHLRDRLKPGPDDWSYDYYFISEMERAGEGALIEELTRNWKL